MALLSGATREELYNDLKTGVLRAACPGTIFQCECPPGCVLSQSVVLSGPVSLYDVLLKIYFYLFSQAAQPS